MDDPNILKRIGELVDEEHAIFEREGSGSPGAGDHVRLREVQITLDQCWDLLRRRRANREFGNDPDELQPRNTTTVERYQK